MNMRRKLTDPDALNPKPSRRRARRKGWSPAVAATMVGALVLGAAGGIPWLLASRDRAKGELLGQRAGQRVGTRSLLPPSSPSSSPSHTQPAGEGDAFFPGFWDATTLEEAREIQRAVDEGHQPWRLDPAAVAERFVRDLVKWRIQVVETSTDGSPEEGWTASVILRPYIGEAEPPSFPGPRHTLRLIGLEGAEHPAWFVAGLESENIVVNTPEPGDPASSPLRVSGRGVAYEGTLHARIEDDAGNMLLRADSQNGILMAGAYEPAPFSGDLRFSPPEAPSGILILSADTGVGPTPAVTIVRLRFEGV
jgi:hypothetical protein